MISSNRWKTTILFSFLIGLAVGLWSVGKQIEENSRLEVVVDLESGPLSPRQPFVLYPDYGKGFHESNALKEVFLEGGRKSLSFRLAPRPIIRLRFDPPSGENSVLVKQVLLFDRSGAVVHRFDLSQAQSEGDPVEAGWEADGFRIRGSSATTDLRLILSKVSEGILPADSRFTGLVGMFALGVGLSTAALSLVVLGLFRHSYRFRRILRFLQTDFPVAQPSFWRGRIGLLLLSAVLFIAVLFLRSWENLTVPSLYAEDASHYFNQYYGDDRDIESVFSRPHQYYNIWNNFVAWTAAKLDVRIQPAIYVLTAAALSIFASVMLAWSGLIRSRAVLFCLPFVLGLSGMNHIFYFTTLTFQMYVTVVILLCLLFLPPPRTRTGLILLCTLALILVFSGPYSVVAVPVSFLALFLFRDPRKRIFWFWVLFCGLWYSRTTTGMAQFSNILDPAVVSHMIDVLFQQVFFLNLLGHFAVWKGVLLLLGIGGLFYLNRRDGEYIRFGLLFLAIVLCAMAPLFLSQKFIDYPDPYPCHLLISQFFWMVFLLYSLDRYLIRSSRSILLDCGVGILLLAFVWTDNEVHPEKGSLRVNSNIASFVDSIYAAEQLDLPANNEYIEIEAEGAFRPAFTPRVRVGSRSPEAINRTER